MRDSVLAMTSSSTPAKRPVVGLLIAIAGVAWLLGIIVPSLLVVSGTSWLAVIVAAALTLAFLLLTLGRSTRIIPRIAFLIATVGWLIFTLNDLHILGQFHMWGAIIALVGTLLAGIFVIMHNMFGRLGDVLFLLAAILISIGLLEEVIKPFLTGSLATVLDYAEAILLILTGIVVLARRK
jgi:hypothetical protein